MLVGFDPEAERRLKELLYTFLEELAVTKACLYLLGTQGSFELVTSYGFGRKDAVLAEVGPESPLYHWLRRHRTGPAYLNDASAEGPLEELLAAGGSSRLLTVPLFVGGELVGFVDARDRGGQVPYGPQEAQRAGQLGQALAAALEELGLYGSRTEAKAPSGGALAFSPTAPPAPSLLFAPTLERLAIFLAIQAAGPEVGGVVLTVAEGASAHSQAWVGVPLESEEREAICRHQRQMAEAVGAALPSGESWRWSELPGVAQKRVRQEIRSACLSSKPFLVLASVLHPAGSRVGEQILTTAGQLFGLSQQEQTARRVMRNALRVLLEPGEVSFPHLRQHSQAVSELAQQMAAELNLSPEEEELVTLAGWLHDVGLRELDYNRLYRVERLGEAEQRLLRRHPVVGARLVEGCEWPELALAIRHHHERWDGHGYPQRLAGQAIPLASRLVHLAEVYDVLTSPASYKRPVGKDEALRLLTQEAGKQFDPELVPVLQRVVKA